MCTLILYWCVSLVFGANVHTDIEASSTINSMIFKQAIMSCFLFIVVTGGAFDANILILYCSVMTQMFIWSARQNEEPVIDRLVNDGGGECVHSRNCSTGGTINNEKTESLLRIQTLQHALDDREQAISIYKLEEIKYEKIISDLKKKMEKERKWRTEQ